MTYNGKDVQVYYGGQPVSGTNPLPVSQVGFLFGINYDAIDVQQTSSTVETYVYKTGGISGTTVKTIVVTYTDSTKENIDTMVGI